MEQRDWQGVFPAITTPFVDGLGRRSRAPRRSTCAGSPTRAAAASSRSDRSAKRRRCAFDEKISILETCRKRSATDVPLIAGIAGLSTAECVALAERAAAVGCDGLMVLPPYVYGRLARDEGALRRGHSARRRSRACSTTTRSRTARTSRRHRCVELSAHANLHAVKESSGDVRRVTAIRETLGDRLVIFAGMDDMILESIPMGASGWVAGLVNAFPVESVRVFELARDGRLDEARALYEWFLPLLRLDTVPKFVQLIKLVQTEVGQGNAVGASAAPRARRCRAGRGDARSFASGSLAGRSSMRRAASRAARSPPAASREWARQLRADLRRRPSSSEGQSNDLRECRAHRRPRRARAPGRVRAHRAADGNERAVASRHQRAGQAQPRARREKLGNDAANPARARRSDRERGRPRVARALRLAHREADLTFAPSTDGDALRGRAFVHVRGRLPVRRGSHAPL